MKGHDQLIAMRQSGVVPDWVFIDTDYPDVLRQWEHWTHKDNAKAHLLVEGERRPDLRCVVGLPVFVQGIDHARVLQIRDACIAVGASRVIAAAMTQHGRGEFTKFLTEHLSDTAGQVAGAAHG